MYILLSGSVRDSSLYNVISLILIFAFVLMLAYFAAKLTAKLQGNPLNKKANIKIVDSYRLGGNKFISIVKIGTNYYALGFGKDEITLIDKLEEDVINLPEGFKAERNDKSIELSSGEDVASEIPELIEVREKKSFKDVLSNVNIKIKQENRDKK